MRNPSARALEQAASDSRALAKAHASTPTWDEAKRELGSALTITDEPDGTRRGRITDHTPDKRHMKRWVAMTREWRRRSMDLGYEANARRERVWLRAPDGSLDHVGADSADSVARKRGLRPVVRWPRTPAFGPDGLTRAGHTHIGKPWPWQVATCPGCRR